MNIYIVNKNMKEINAIIKAFEEAEKKGEQTALATVVKVVGSSYRRPGARMLVTENGVLTGAISGGCLEGDALKKAQLVMLKKQSMVVTYDTTDEDDAKFGVGLGCNGIIHILIEPIDPQQEWHPINLLKACLVDRKPKVLATIFDLNQQRKAQVGTCWLKSDHEAIYTVDLLSGYEESLNKMADRVIEEKKSWIVPLEQQQVFLELVQAPLQLLVIGAGNDAIPLTQLANILGWEITLIDGRENHANAARFPHLNSIKVVEAEKVIRGLELDERTAMILMTHKFIYEFQVLHDLLPINIDYVGVLWPTKTLVLMIE